MSKGMAIALGMFDSVHIGHKAVINGVFKDGCHSAVLTFDSLPTKDQKKVLTNDEKREKLLATGVDTVEMLDFENFRNLSPKEFLDCINRNGTIKRVACGFNYRFGKKAEGDTAFLRKYCEENGIEYFEAPEVCVNGKTVSTTYIKELLADGKIEKANELLVEPFSIAAPVINGAQRGRKLGFPTANQKYPEEKCPIKNGVYRTRVTMGMQVFNGVTDIGVRPTFNGDCLLAETYIIGFKGDCYDNNIKVSFLEFLRDEKRFDSKEALTAAIKENVEYVMKKA